ncbi:MAG: hypothetical protein PUF84_01930 [Ruminococcus bromii]|nr:hypothetical protein [Ruminococcus bromii]MDD6433363.1 hypothetical protein [Ruminococcus bromii]MDY4085525.1 hypothetical protein [Ruminococcus bromii]MDY4711940.1 hypothetical protein [Ruminococcus bromii]
MENVMTKGFTELSVVEMDAVNGGQAEFFKFVSDIYKDWNSMWKEFGRNLYHQING